MFSKIKTVVIFLKLSGNCNNPSPSSKKREIQKSAYRTLNLYLVYCQEQEPIHCSNKFIKFIIKFVKLNYLFTISGLH